jgi:hypothetical protein
MLNNNYRIPNTFGFVSLSMSGVTAFMSSIEYDTPSGYPPHSRITEANIPHPIPKIIMPVFVTGDVTMSVAIKNAPKISPPENT